MDYMRHAMKTKDAEIDVLKKKWQEYQEVQERMSNYEKDRMGEKDLLRKRAEQIDALQHKVIRRHIHSFSPCSKRSLRVQEIFLNGDQHACGRISCTCALPKAVGSLMGLQLQWGLQLWCGPTCCLFRQIHLLQSVSMSMGSICYL